MAGHETVGQWSLGQICNHLATAVRLTVEVPPTPSHRPSRRRFAVGSSGRAGSPMALRPLIPSLLPETGPDARTEADALREVLRRFAMSDGPFVNHPVLGALTKDEWTQFHCMYCAHHLSFAVLQTRDVG
jgi:Protein of unknown function (DUF1569)